MIARFGFCTICGKETAPLQNGRRVPSSQFTEVEVEWSNKSKMKIGVCTDCATENKHATAHGKSAITQAHQEYWDAHQGVYDKGVIVV